MKKLLSYFLFTLILTIGWTGAIAQHSIGNLMVKNQFKGDQYFLDFYYEKAITHYMMALKKDDNKDAIRLKIADSFRLLRDYDRAVYWYAQVMDNNPEEAEAAYKYYYADMLLATSHYEEALNWFKDYQTEKPEDSRSGPKIEGLNNLQAYYFDSAITRINSLPINTPYSEVAPAPYKNNLVFLSAREQFSFVDNDYLRKEDLYDVYSASYDSISGWGETVSFDKVINTPFHEGPVSFYTGEDKLLLTRSNYYNKRQTTGIDGKTKLQLYTAVKTGDIWSNIQPFELNDRGYNIAHPALNYTNDTLYFASDMPGGLGGSDLYMSINSNGWSDPVNLGPKVNTEGNELFPSYVSDRLFFSSDGRDGLGGLDVYKAYIENGHVQAVVNLGSPINSSMDDFSYSIDPQSKTGYFSSNRIGSMGSDDIYSFEQKAQILNGIAIQEQDKTPLSGVYINLIQDGLIVATTITGEDGSFRFVLPLLSDFQIIAEKDEHSFKTDIKLTTKGSRVDIDTLLIQLHKHDFFARGLIYNSQTQSVMNDVRVIIKDESSQQIDTVSTGLNGLYSFVIEPGKDYIIRAEKKRFSSDSARINTYSLNKGVITNDFLLEEEYIDKEIIFFDYNEFDLKPETIPILQKALSIARRYPDDWLIIGAHADARGSEDYNQELSEKRAKSVVDYFLAKGISKDKIIARGFGEGLILNRCVDGVNCREEDHSKNRRAEIAIEEKLPEEKLDNKGF